MVNYLNILTFMVLLGALTWPCWADSPVPASPTPVSTGPSCEWLSGPKNEPVPLAAAPLLARPKLLLPLFETVVTAREVATHGILFQWAELPEAKQYRLQIFLQGLPVFENKSAATRFLLPQLAPGFYRWKVSALFTLKNIPSKGATWSCQGTQSFWFDLTVLPASDEDGSKALVAAASTGNTHISFVSRVVSYLYRSSSDLSPGGSAAPAIAPAAILAGEYRLSRRLAVGASLENTFYQIEGRGVNGTAFEMYARANVPWKQKPDWIFFPALGFRVQRYFVFTRPCTGCPPPYTEAIALGLAASNELSKQLSPSLRLGIGLELFFPLALASAPADSQMSGINFNIAASVYGAQKLNPRWELRYGGYYEHRGFSFATNGSKNSTHLDALGGFVGVAMRFPP